MYYSTLQEAYNLDSFDKKLKKKKDTKPEIPDSNSVKGPANLETSKLSASSEKIDDYKETVRIVDGANAYYENQKSTYFDLALGGGLGYKMYFKDKFAVEFLIGFGRNLIDTDKSPDVLSRVGLNFGYRF